MQYKIKYSITPQNPQAHIFSIRCTILEPDPNGQILWLPAWIPGSYMIRDFAKNIVSISANADGTHVAIQKLDKQTWQCAPCKAPLIIEYTVYAWDLSVRSAHLDTTHAFFNGSSVFLAVKGQEDLPVSVTINLPRGEAYANWQVATALTTDGAEQFSAGAYAAENYDELIDHPVEMGKFEIGQFKIGDTPHYIIISGRHQCDMKRLCDDVKKICQTQVALFGEFPDMQHYLFLLTVVENGYGGLEHRSSSALICSRTDLPIAGRATLTDKYITLLGLFSHEYFHTWNIKRIKPDEFIPYNLKEETYTRQLWAFEGITSYYDDLALVRSGVIDEAAYLKLLGKTISRVHLGEGRFRQTLHESSFDAWTKFYKQDENAPNAIVSYYAKGALFALCLDLHIRSHHQGKSLDDIMRVLWTDFGKKNIGTQGDTIRRLVAKIVAVPSDEFFDRYLDTTQDLPLAELLTGMGIMLKSRPAEADDDLGGTAPNTASSYSDFNLGAKLVSDPLGAKVQIIFDQGAFQQAGIATGDIIIAINALKVTSATIQDLLASHAAGDKVEVHIFRRDELMTLSVTLQAAVQNRYYLETMPDEHPTQMRHAWLCQAAQSTASISSK